MGRSQRLEIIRELKLSEGLPVKEIARRLGMSYMGIKQHCLALERGGFVDTWRSPRESVGRPELLYRLTRKADELYPVESNRVTLAVLDAARQLWGPTAPGKLLLLVFRDQTKAYLGRIRGESAKDRAKWFARVRDREGCLSRFEEDPCPRIVENHSPIADLLEAYPDTGRLEQEMFTKVLGTEVRRTATRSGGRYRAEFQISGD